MIGVDDAGRGVLIGPMVVAGVKASEGQLKKLRAAGVKDSKKFSASRLKALAKIVKENVDDFVVKTISAERMNKRDKKMDDFERESIEQIVRELGGGDAIADNVSRPHLVKSAKVVTKGERHTEVAAASILASEHYLRVLDKLKTKYGDFGSGNPNDPKTIGWLKEWWGKKGVWPPFVRTFFKTIPRIEDEVVPEKL